MTQSPLKLTRAYPEHIHIETDIEGVADADYDLESQLTFEQNRENQRIWRVGVDVKFGGKEGVKSAHSGRVRYVGVFSIDEAVPKERVERIVAVTAPSILYSSIRELVALLTGRGPGQSVLLPTVSFLDAVSLLQKAESPQPSLPAKPATRLKGAKASVKK